MSYMCNKSIIECLRDRKTYPIVDSSNHYQNNLAINAINYSNNNYFDSSGKSASPWWSIDFGEVVTLKSYSIHVEVQGCNWIKKWKASFSLNIDHWSVFDSPPEGHPKGENHTIKKPVKARYFKIESLDGVCNNVMAFKYIYFYEPSLKPRIFTCRCKRGFDFRLMILTSLMYS